jgi:hypothetical protein
MVDFSAIGGIFRKILFFIALLAIAAFFGTGPLLKWAIVHYGEAATGAQVKLAELSFNPFAGKIGLKDFYVYNPIGFTNAPALYVGNLEVRVKPGSIFSDHLVIEDIVVNNPEILFEGGVKRSNLTVLQHNVQDYVSAMLPETATVSEDPNAELKKAREYSIDRLMITNPTLRVSTQVVDKQVTITMQDIVMTDIGKGGTDAATLFASVMQPFMNIVNTSVMGNLGALGTRLKDNAMGINNAINDFFRGGK